MKLGIVSDIHRNLPALLAVVADAGAVDGWQRDRRIGAVRVVNPGSVGLPAYDDEFPYPHEAESGSPHARYALVEEEGPRWRVQLRGVVYDWEGAAGRAEANRRGDWADALRSGRVGRREREVIG